jgi:hypothetical protein
MDMKGKLTFTGIMRIIGLGLMFFGMYTMFANMMKVFSYEKAGAEIIRIEENAGQEDKYGYTGYKSSKKYYAKYTVDGVEYENMVYPPYGGGYEGMEVTVKYDPRDPSKIIYDEDGMSVSQGAPLALGVIFVAVSTYMSANRSRKYMTNI